MRIVINPDFLSLEGFIKRLPSCFEIDGRTIYKVRNEIKLFEENGMLINVKSYRKPIFINRIIYTFFRKSKARRAYENALEIISRGFDTARPIAYIEERKGGLLYKSYFICLQCDYNRMFREFADNSDIKGRENILQAFGRYLARMHDSGILHLDLSIGNILFDVDESGVHFCLIDLNRMKFQHIDEEKGCKNFERLRGNLDFFRVLSDSYAKDRGFNADKCLNTILKYYEKSVRKFARKSELKKRMHKDHLK